VENLQSTDETVHYEEEQTEETFQQEPQETVEQPSVQEDAQPQIETPMPVSPVPTEKSQEKNGEDRSGFLHGMAVGLGFGCVATFVVVWLTVFFTPLVPSEATYENLLSIFIYPMIYLLAVGLVALTAGIVREYFTRRR
jgi:hypothetical protein